MVTVKTLFEQSSFVQELEHKSYVLLQKRLVTGGTSTRPDVLVIDISNIKPEPWERDGRSGIATPRDSIKDLINVLTDLHARSVGIDVDFSFLNGEPVHPDDPKFFDWCLGRSEEKDIPILLGVYRTQTQPHKWLGDDRYMRLAASIAIPSAEHGQSLQWIVVNRAHAPLPSMAAALAGVNLGLNNRRESAWSWALESISNVERADNLRSAESVIDFAPLQRIREDVLPALKAEFFHAMEDKIRNRMVLVGDATKGDTFAVPGVDSAVPGIFLHACAANTIVNEPLYRLTLLGRVTIDVIIVALIFVLANAAIWLTSLVKSRIPISEQRLAFAFTLLAIIIILLISVGLIRWVRLLWTDFLLVCAVLLAHSMIDLFRDKLLHKAK